MADESSIKQDHYFDRKYLKRERMYSFVEQIEVLKKHLGANGTLLEVGKGNGFVSGFLQQYLGYADVKTMDVNESLHPDYVDDIVSPSVLQPNSFDVVSCFEVLEHMPFKQSRQAVQNMARIARKFVLVSVPDMRYFISARFAVFGTLPLQLGRLFSTRRFRNKNKTFGADHHWEIGFEDREKGVRYSVAYLRQELFAGMNVIADYRDIAVPWHHYFVLKTGN